ncbi:MAG: HlyD family secretion protein [Bacteroidota bacterium]
MKKKHNIEIHNEEVREIMQEIPGRLLRWGLTIIFLIFASIIVGSYFFTFKEIVSAPLVITTTNPPAAIIAKSSGRIARWFVSDGRQIKQGEEIALIKNSTSLADFRKAEKALIQIDTTDVKSNLNIVLPGNLMLGELQDSYSRCCNHRKNYRDYLAENYLPEKIELLRRQMQKQQEHYQLSLKQQKMMEKELEISKNGLERHQSLLDKGGVSESQIEEAEARVIQSERSYTGFVASLKSAEITMINQERSLLELQEQHHANIKQFEMDILNGIRTLKNQFKAWKDNYLLTSPIDGKVTLTKFWSENHVVTAGERLATVVPGDSSVVICRAVVPSSGIGKVEKEQPVHVKLAGYPYMEHGMLTGKVSAVSLVPEEQGYIVGITLNEGMISSYSEQLKLVQEMEGTAEIITKEMRLIYRFINPLKMIFNK